MNKKTAIALIGLLILIVAAVPVYAPTNYVDTIAASKGFTINAQILDTRMPCGDSAGSKGFHISGQTLNAWDQEAPDLCGFNAPPYCQCDYAVVGGCCNGCDYCPAGTTFNGMKCIAPPYGPTYDQKDTPDSHFCNVDYNCSTEPEDSDIIRYRYTCSGLEDQCSSGSQYNENYLVRDECTPDCCYYNETLGRANCTGAGKNDLNFFNFYNGMGDVEGPGIKISNKQNITIKNCKIYSFEKGIELNNAYNITFINNQIEASGEEGILISSDSSNNSFTNTRACNNNQSLRNSYYDINDKNTTNNFTNTICDTANNTGCDFGCDEDILSGCKKSDWKQGRTYYLGKNLEPTETCMNITADNVVLDCQGRSMKGDLDSNDYGIYINNHTNVTIRNCKITNFGTGISIESSNNNTLIFNTIYNNSEDGIIFTNSNNSNISSNIIYNNYDGIELKDYSENNYVGLNFVYLNDNFGIYLQYASNNIIIDNTVEYNLDGIYADSSSADNTIKNNKVQLNEDSGIVLEGDDNNLTNNIACFNNQTGAGSYQEDIYDAGSGNTFNDNFCDTGVTCTYSCSQVLDSCKDTWSADTIYFLTEDVQAYGNCMEIDADNVTLDCKNHFIVGDGTGKGIDLADINNITVKNCNIQNFAAGINLHNSSDDLLLNITAGYSGYGILSDTSDFNNLTSITANYNGYGILLGESSNNTLEDIQADNNAKSGIYITSNSEDNTLTDIEACTNNQTYYDINATNIAGENTFTNTKCDVFWNGTDNIGCDAACPVRLASCLEQGDWSQGGVYHLITDISSSKLLDNGNCMEISAHNVTLDCQGHTIRGDESGFGIRIAGYDNITIKNCKISYFRNAIYAQFAAGLGNVENMYIINNTLNYNNQDGIHLQDTVNVYVINNTANYNGEFGIEDSTGGVTLSNNIVCHNNQSGGPFYDIYVSGTETNTTCDTMNGGDGCDNSCPEYLHVCRASGWESYKTYILTEDVDDVGTCMNIDASNIVLDCQGHSITGGFGYGYLDNGKNDYCENNEIYDCLNNTAFGDAQCWKGGHCTDSRICEEDFENREACTRDGQCKSDRCINGTCWDDRSLIENLNELIDFEFNLLMKVQRLTDFGWLDVTGSVINENIPRTLEPGQELKLQDIWNSNPWNTSGQEPGRYRIYAAATDSRDEPLRDRNTVLLEDWYEFTISERVINLLSPINNVQTGLHDIPFICGAYDSSGLDNVSLWTNITGTWNRTYTVNLAGGPTEYILSHTIDNIPNGKYKWTCQAYSNNSLEFWSSDNWTFTITNKTTDMRCYIAATPAACIADNGTDIMHISGYYDAHGELNNQTNYDLTVCCKDTNLSTNCTGGYNILNLSSQTNAHADITGNYTVYPYNVCIKSEEWTEQLNCTARYLEECNADEVCVVELSDNTSAHLADCLSADYDYRICCGITIGLGPGCEGYGDYLVIDSPCYYSNITNSTKIDSMLMYSDNDNCTVYDSTEDHVQCINSTINNSIKKYTQITTSININCNTSNTVEDNVICIDSVINDSIKLYTYIYNSTNVNCNTSNTVEDNVICIDSVINDSIKKYTQITSSTNINCNTSNAVEDHVLCTDSVINDSIKLYTNITTSTNINCNTSHTVEINVLCTDSVINNSRKINSNVTDSIVLFSNNSLCNIVDSYEYKSVCTNSDIINESESIECRITGNSLLYNSTCIDSNITNSKKYNSTIIISRVEASTNYNCTIVNTTEVGIICYNANITDGCIQNPNGTVTFGGINYTGIGICLDDLYSCNLIGNSTLDNTPCIASDIINSTKVNSTLTFSTNNNCTVYRSEESFVNCIDSVINDSIKEYSNITGSIVLYSNNTRCDVVDSYEYRVNCTDSNITDHSTKINSTVINSKIESSNNTECRITDSTEINVNCTDSNITATSTVIDSNVTNKCYLESATLISGECDNSTIFESDKYNSTVINSIINNSIDYNCTIIDSVEDNVYCENSTIQNQSYNRLCIIKESYEEDTNCTDSNITDDSSSTGCRINDNSLLYNSTCIDSNITNSKKYNSTIIISRVEDSTNYNCTIVNTTETSITCYNANITDDCIQNIGGKVTYEGIDYIYDGITSVCLSDIYQQCILIGDSNITDSNCTGSFVINSTKTDSKIINSTNLNCTVNTSTEINVNCTDSTVYDSTKIETVIINSTNIDCNANLSYEKDSYCSIAVLNNTNLINSTIIDSVSESCNITSSTLINATCDSSVIINSNKTRAKDITLSYNYNCNIEAGAGNNVNEYNVNCTDSNISGNSDISNSDLLDSSLTNVTISAGSFINNSILTNCIVINSLVKNYIGSDCYLVNAVIDPPGPPYNLTGSNITDSSVYHSDVINSNVSDNSYIYNSTVIDSNIINSTVNNTNITNSNVTNSIKINSNIINSTVNNSYNINCDVINGVEIGKNCTDNCGDGICEALECNFCSLDCNFSTCCPNGQCNSFVGETYTTCPADCPAPPAPAPKRRPSGGGGAAFLSACYEDWNNCTEWGPCTPEGLQYRTCNDKNRCDERYNQQIIERVYTTKRPPVVQNCTYVAVETCNDRIQNQDETDIDCGGTTCPRCEDGRKCSTDRDCINRCDAAVGICYTPVLPKVEVPAPPPKPSILPYILISLAAVALIVGGVYTYLNLEKMGFYQRYMAGKESKITEARRAAEEERKRLSALERKKKLALKELHKRLRKEYADKLEMFLDKAVDKGYKKSNIKKVLISKGWPAEFVNKYVDAYFKEHHIWIKKIEAKQEGTPDYAKLQSQLENVKGKLKK